MIDIICSTDLLFQMHIVVDGSNDIFLGDMLRNQFVDISVDRFFQRFLIISAFSQNVL